MANFVGGISILIVLMIICSSIPGVPAVTHYVGDSSGWEAGLNYENWASGQTFEVADSLIFYYDEGPNSVCTVPTADDYDKCNLDNVLHCDNESPTTIPLNDPGLIYIISGTNDYCEKGVKLSVNVVPESSK